MPQVDVGVQTDLFLRTIWGETPNDPEKDTYVYVAFATRNQQGKIAAWDPQFYVWPQDEAALISDIERRKAHEEVYFAPSLLDKKDPHKDATRGSWVYWVDFDGDVPAELKGVPAPTIKVKTSDSHEHWYWRNDAFSSPDVTEERNRALLHAFGAGDNGCWNINRVLRPPNTFNHKRKRKVEVVQYSDTALPVGLMSGLPTPPPVQEILLAEIEQLPDVTEIVFRYKFPEHVYKLFTSSVQGPTGGEEGRRSTTLMSLAFSLAEIGLTNEEIVAMLNNCCERWGKFQGRADKFVQLTKIVSIARRKYPFVAPEDTTQPLQPIGFQTLLATEVKLEWVWAGWLQESGYMLLTGPPGVGKTQMSLGAGMNFALGRDYLGRRVTKPRKVAFLSLEMGITDLKEFMLLMATAFTQEEQEALQENLLILPLGEPLYMNRAETKTQVEQMVGDYKLDGLIIDSLSSTVEGELKDETTVKTLMDWNDHLRQQFNCFTWIIHHHRKGNSTNKKPNKLDDVYGPYLLTARATSVFCLWPTAVTNALEVRPLKVRLSPTPPIFYVKRSSALHFETVSGAAVGMADPTSLSPSQNSATSEIEGPNITVIDEPTTGTRKKFEI